MSVAVDNITFFGDYAKAAQADRRGDTEASVKILRSLAQSWGVELINSGEEFLEVWQASGLDDTATNGLAITSLEDFAAVDEPGAEPLVGDGDSNV